MPLAPPRKRRASTAYDLVRAEPEEKLWKLPAVRLSGCPHEHAVIVGPGCTEYALGRSKCAESYRELATSALTPHHSARSRRSASGCRFS